MLAIPGSAPRMMSNCALIAVTAPSSGRRCSDSTLCNADDSVASPSEVRLRLLRTRISGGEDGDDDDRQHDAEEDQQVLVAHASANPSVSAFM